MIYLGPKNIRSFIADIKTANNKLITITFTSSIDKKCISHGWKWNISLEQKAINDAFARHLLTQTSDKLTASRNATETNHASCSSNGVVVESLHVSETTMRWVLYYSWCSQCCVSSIKWTNLHNFLQHAMFSSSASIFSNINTYKDARCVCCVHAVIE